NPWPMAWPESSETRTTSATSRLRLIDPSEILEHESPLLRTQPLQLFPRGIPESRAHARGAGLQCRRQMNAIPPRRAADALFFLVRLVVREGAPGVEQPVIQSLLTLDRRAVEPASLELARQLLRLLRERPCSRVRPTRLDALELLGQRALARGEGPELLRHGVSAGARHRQESLGLSVQALLVARQARELFDRLREAAARLCPRHAITAPGQRERRGVEGIACLFRGPGRFGGIGIGFLELAPRHRHLTLRVPERRVELGRNERVLAC